MQTGPLALHLHMLHGLGGTTRATGTCLPTELKSSNSVPSPRGRGQGETRASTGNQLEYSWARATAEAIGGKMAEPPQPS